MTWNNKTFLESDERNRLDIKLWWVIESSLVLSLKTDWIELPMVIIWSLKPSIFKNHTKEPQYDAGKTKVIFMHVPLLSLLINRKLTLWLFVTFKVIRIPVEMCMRSIPKRRGGGGVIARIAVGGGFFDWFKEILGKWKLCGKCDVYCFQRVLLYCPEHAVY